MTVVAVTDATFEAEVLRSELPVFAEEGRDQGVGRLLKAKHARQKLGRQGNQGFGVHIR